MELKINYTITAKYSRKFIAGGWNTKLMETLINSPDFILHYFSFVSFPCFLYIIHHFICSVDVSCSLRLNLSRYNYFDNFTFCVANSSAGLKLYYKATKCNYWLYSWEKKSLSTRTLTSFLKFYIKFLYKQFFLVTTDVTWWKQVMRGFD